MAWWRLTVTAGLLAFALMTLLVTAALMTGTNIIRRDVLAYSAPGRTGYDDIFVYEPASGHRANLTRVAADDSRPAWSPDGRLLAFRSNRSGGEHFYILETATGVLIDALPDASTGRVTDDWPLWSSDGQYLLFLRQTLPADGLPAIFYVSRQGQPLGWLDISHLEAQRYLQQMQPTRFVSSRGAALFFDLVDGERWGLFLQTARTTPARLIYTLEADVTPRTAAWSPDGRWAAFVVQQGAARSLLLHTDRGELHIYGRGDNPAWRP